MFVFLESRKDIADAQGKLERTLKRDFSKRAIRDIGYPGGRQREAEVATNGHYWFWSRDHRGREVHNPRRLNWFGRYSENPGTSISVEINVAYEGRNDASAGFFGRDTDTGAVYLLHSGRVGGGKKGVGKKAFCASSGEPLVNVFDSTGASRQGLIVMPVEGAGASASAVRYVAFVDKFKQAVRNDEINTPAFRATQKRYEEFYAEGRGQRKGKRASIIDYLSRHGEVVDALQMWREAASMPRGGRIVKNVLIDMGVAVGGSLVEVFEVKTSAQRQLIYTALGQLMIHGESPDCRRVMLLPEKEILADDLAEALTRLGIELMRFSLSETEASILGD